MERKKNVSLSQTAEKLRDILDETGFDYYISGLDILQKYMLHIPEQYPIVICIQKESKNELTDILTNHFYEVVEPRRLKEKYEAIQYNGKNNDIIIIYLTENFEDSEDGLATIEKAFVDLYYAVTRNGYPLAFQELVRIYENLVRLGNIDKKRMVAVAAIATILAQGLAQTFLVRIPMSYFMSIQPDASLTKIGLAAPTATVFGIILCSIYFVVLGRKEKI